MELTKPFSSKALLVLLSSGAADEDTGTGKVRKREHFTLSPQSS